VESNTFNVFIETIKINIIVNERLITNSNHKLLSL